MERAVLFFDIDGTVISDDTKKVPESAARALQEAQERGHLLFINTGRTICSVPSEVRRVRFDGYLCGCGTYLLYGDEILFARSVPRERGKKIIEEIEKCRLGGVAEGVEDVYFPGRIWSSQEDISGKKVWGSNSLWSPAVLPMTNCLYTQMERVIWNGF